MKKIIALSGAPGAGKTYARTHDYALKYLPYIDIADIYKEYYPIDYPDAFAVLIEKLIPGLQEHDCIVIEASLNKGSFQRMWLDLIAHYHEAEVEYWEFLEDAHICLERVKQQYEDALFAASPQEAEQAARYYTARMRILERDLYFY